MRVAIFAVSVGFSFALEAQLKPTTLEKPVYVQIVQTDGEKVSGSLVRFDADTLYIRTGKGDKELSWSQLTGSSQYAVRQQVIDRRSAAAWLELAEFGMTWNLTDQVKMAVAQAAKIDPSTKSRGEAILSGQSGTGATTDPTTRVIRYRKASPEEEARAITIAQKVAKGVGEAFSIHFTELQTPHFIIFTDWAEKDHEFLKKNVEAAYAAVSKQFDIPVKDNIFVGKLPVFMFDKQADFMKYAVNVDGFPVSPGVAGYFTQHKDGSGHMAMWRPDPARFKGDQKAAETRWAYTLTHEFTHAFISRYRTNVRIPRWLNEGLAEVIASGEFPRPEAHARARMMAEVPFEFENLFNDRMMPGASMYPVMQTMVEALIKENRKAFLTMFNDIKDGMEPEAAMKKNYKAGYRDWEPAWRKYARELRE